MSKGRKKTRGSKKEEETSQRKSTRNHGFLDNNCWMDIEIMDSGG